MINLRKLTFLFFILAINFALRLPAVFQELPPLQFCDESLFSKFAYEQNYLLDAQSTQHLTSGAPNFLIPAKAAQLWTSLTGHKLNLKEFVVIARLTTATLLSSLAISITVFAVSFLAARRVVFLTAWVLTTSPFLLSNSRISYPDHYIIFGISLIFLFSTLLSEPGRARAWWLTISSGLATGLSASIKYHSGLMLLLPLMVVLRRFWHSKKRLTFHIGLLCLFAFLMFYWANRLMLDGHWNMLWEALKFSSEHYRGGHPGQQSDHAFFWHLKTLALMSYGVFGIIPALVGVRLFRHWPFALKAAVGAALLLVVVLGNFNLAVARTLMPTVLIYLVMVSFGMAEIFSWVQRRSKVWLIGIAIVFSAEPLLRVVWLLQNDFQKDSRNAAITYLESNFLGNERWGGIYACWGNPVPEHFQVTVINWPYSKNDMKSCFNYFVLDRWHEDTMGNGTNPLLLPVWSELIYKNTTQYPQNWFAEVHRYLEDFVEIKRFDSQDFYGPTISVFKRKVLCANP